jgi:hydroxymethylpyrimidine/phosphomethylpyrimidine kinase
MAYPGDRLLSADAVAGLRTGFIPRAALITPNF